jgi:drug/metabolite transporter (DMT)-like permease
LTDSSDQTLSIRRQGGLRSVDLALLLLLATLWGASYAFIRVAVATIPPLTLMAARTLIAGTLLVAWMSASGTPLPRSLGDWRRFALQALLNSVVPFTLIAWGEQYVDAGLATILNSASPVLTFMITWLVTRHERVTPRKLFGVVAGLAGIVLIVGVSAASGLGRQVPAQLAIVLATVCYACGAIYGRSFNHQPAAVPAAGSLIVGAAVLAPLSLLVDRPWTLSPSSASIGALAGLSVFSTAVAFVVYFRLVKTLGSVGTTAQAYLRVPIGVVIGIVFLGESPAPTAWIGMACVVTAVAAMTLPSRRRA